MENKKKCNLGDGLFKGSWEHIDPQANLRDKQAHRDSWAQTQSSVQMLKADYV